MSGSGEEMNWQLAHDSLTFSKPETCNALTHPEGEENYQISCYEDFVQAKHPKLEGETEEQAKERCESIYSMRAKFAAAGGAGSKFRSLQEKMLKALNLPKGAREELGIIDECMEPVEEEPPTFKQAEEGSDDEETVAERARQLAEKKMRYKLFN